MAVFMCCTLGIRRPSSTQLSMSGTVYASGQEHRGDVLPDATVSLIDVRSGQTLATDVTTGTGSYRLVHTVTEGQPLVFAVAAKGFAPAARALTVGSSTELTFSLSLEPLSPLECAETSCAPDREDVWWVAPPPEASGGVVARLPFIARGFVGLLGAPAETGCVEGTLSAEGSPALGALVMSAERLGEVRPNGGFCLETTPGPSPVRTRAMYAGLLSTLPPLPRPSASGRCGAGSSCAQAGTVTLAANALVAAQLCTFIGKLVDPQGAPVPLSQVTAFDDTLAGTAFNGFCGKLGTRCSIAAASDDDGAFALKAPLFTRLVVEAEATVDSDAGPTYRRGSLVLTECPREPITLKLTRGMERLYGVAAYSGSTVTWTPPRASR
jgi:hypothetical protein